MSTGIQMSLGKNKPERPVSEVQTRTTFGKLKPELLCGNFGRLLKYEIKFGAQNRVLEPYSSGSLEEEVSVAEELCSASLNPGDLAHHLHTPSKSDVLGTPSNERHNTNTRIDEMETSNTNTKRRNNNPNNKPKAACLQTPNNLRYKTGRWAGVRDDSRGLPGGIVKFCRSPEFHKRSAWIFCPRSTRHLGHQSHECGVTSPGGEEAKIPVESSARRQHDQVHAEQKSGSPEYMKVNNKWSQTHV